VLKQTVQQAGSIASLCFGDMLPPHSERAVCLDLGGGTVEWVVWESPVCPGPLQVGKKVMLGVFPISLSFMCKEVNSKGWVPQDALQ